MGESPFISELLEHKAPDSARSFVKFHVLGYSISASFILVLFLVFNPISSDLSYLEIRVAFVVCVELSQFFSTLRAVCYYLVPSFLEPYICGWLWSCGDPTRDRWSLMLKFWFSVWVASDCQSDFLYCCEFNHVLSPAGFS